MTRFIFGFAGIPQEIRTEVERENRRFAESADFFIDKMPNYVPYGQRNVDFFINKFYDKVSTDKGNSLTDTAFCIVYLVRDAKSTDFFTEAFFPHTMMIPVHWELDSSGGANAMGEAKNALVKLLEQATKTAKAALRALRHEVVSNASSTPLLLPLLNFSSGVLEPVLRGVHEDLIAGVLPKTAIDQQVGVFRRTHPYKHVDGAERSCYTDDADIVFRPPGSHRHGFARAGTKHPPRCVLAGRRRMGAPYDPMFHYDCIREGGARLTARMHNCHEAKSMWEGNPNINVAPNDNLNVRGNASK